MMNAQKYTDAQEWGLAHGQVWDRTDAAGRAWLELEQREELRDAFDTLVEFAAANERHRECGVLEEHAGRLLAPLVRQYKDGIIAELSLQPEYDEIEEEHTR